MLHFEEVLNVREVVWRGLQEEDWFIHSGEDLVSDSLCIIGRERDASFLFRFSTSTSAVSSAHPISSLKRRSHIGIYNIAENRVRTLLSLEKEEEVTHCTVNEQQSLLAFCVASDGPIKTKSSTTKEIRLYIADVQQGARRNTVQLEIVAESLEHTKSAQFLHRCGTDRRVKLIVFEHCEYIGVVHLVVDSTGKLRDRIAKRYKPDWIVGKHFWYQWDVQRQHLFTITSDNRRNNVNLEVYQISDKTTLDKLFSVPITIDSKAKRPRVSKVNLDQRTQDRNIVMLTNMGNISDGVLCLCNQVPYERRDSPEADGHFTLYYELFSLVHEKSLHISVPHVPWRLRKMCIHFTLIGNYVVAYLPDVFTHIINVHDIADLGELNIIGRGENHSRVADSRGSLTRLLLELPQFRARSGAYMYDSESMLVYNIAFNDVSLRDKFSERWSAGPQQFPVNTSTPLTNQLAILQHMLQTTADAKRARELLELMKNDVTNADCMSVLTEYIIGSSFAVTSRRSEANKAFCRMLPVTSTGSDAICRIGSKAKDLERSYTVPVEGDRREGTQCDIKVDIYDKRPVIIDILDEASVKKDCDFFQFLYLIRTNRNVKRFKIQEVSRYALEESSVKKRNPSILNSLRNKLSISRQPSQPAGSPLYTERGASLDPTRSTTFPDCLLNEDVNDKLISNLYAGIAGHVRLVYQTTSSRVPANSKPNPLFTVDTKRLLQEFETVSWTYAKILINQVKVLLHHLYKMFDLKELHNKQFVAHDSEDLGRAFLLFERYRLVVLDLDLPLPVEFPTVFATLAYQSLTPEEFMQYVSCGIVQLTDDFLHILALDNTTGKAVVKSECLANMESEEALKWSYKLMNSPVVGATATRLVAESVLSRYCGTNPPRLVRGQSQGGSGRRESTASITDGSYEEGEFDPQLPDSYCHLLSKIRSAGWTPSTEGSLTTQMLESAVFYYTTADNI